MKLYYSGGLGRTDILVDEMLIKTDAYRLCTFAYPKEATYYLDLADTLGKRARVMIDSGAFTAWSLGKPVELPKLIYYVKGLLAKYGDRHEFIFIALDVMPGEKNRRPTEAELKAGMQKSYENYIEYKAEMEGYEILPVYHTGEPIQLRDWYMKHTDYICLSMNLGMSEQNRIDWALRVSVTGLRTHGLAATGARMTRYVDWFSVDSAAWVKRGAMGQIYWPNNTGFLKSFTVSAISGTRKVHNANVATTTFSEDMIAIIQDRGYTLEQLQHDRGARLMWNVEVWNEADSWKKVPVKEKGLFDD